MLRYCMWLSVVVLLVSLTTIGNCQAPQPRSWGGHPHMSFCKPPQQARPVSRTVRVDVPVPCPSTSPCAPVAACVPYSRCAPPCPPRQATRPVNVRVDVVVRPEAPKKCVPKRYCCENPPVFEPFFCRAANMLGSMIVAPLCLGERFLGHGFPRQPCPPPIPISCAPAPVVQCAGGMCGYPPPGPGCVPQRYPAVKCRPQGAPVAWQAYGPHRRNAPF